MWMIGVKGSQWEEVRGERVLWRGIEMEMN